MKWITKINQSLLSRTSVSTMKTFSYFEFVACSLDHDLRPTATTTTSTTSTSAFWRTTHLLRFDSGIKESKKCRFRRRRRQRRLRRRRLKRWLEMTIIRSLKHDRRCKKILLTWRHDYASSDSLSITPGVLSARHNNLSLLLSKCQ